MRKPFVEIARPWVFVSSSQKRETDNLSLIFAIDFAYTVSRGGAYVKERRR